MNLVDQVISRDHVTSEQRDDMGTNHQDKSSPCQA